jgi:hypothetical protein
MMFGNFLPNRNYSYEKNKPHVLHFNIYSYRI